MRHLCGGNRKKKHTGCQSVKLFWDRSKVADKKVVYMENTYRLGYECMQMIETYGKKKKMESIFLQPLKLDREILEAGSLDALLAR